jgi:cell volume regulation protein A
MFAIDRLVLIAGALILLGIISSKLSWRLGLPVLVLFMVIGMLAGSEGIGRFAFENYAVAHGVGTIALIVILFDGGLRTPASQLRRTLGPAATLATAGVLLTAMVTAAAVHLVLGAGWLVSLLVGSIVSSTDAAAVLSVLRSQGLHVRKRVGATLEIESASNDPMAVFLTVAILQVLLGQRELGIGLLGLFVMQMGLGTLVGLAFGKLTLEIVNRINLTAAGLYPVLTSTAGLLAFGVAAAIGGSGFLATYLAGVVIGNGRLIFRRGIFQFHDGTAWLAQIAMFVMLGLLSFPSRLIEAAPAGLLIAATLLFVARPLTVALLLKPFRFRWNEILFVGWGGLKGAVPVVLATFPLLLGLPAGPVIFDVVFFVVLVSAVLQGWTLPLVARRLDLETPSLPSPPVTLEITSLRDVDGDIVEYTVTPESRAANRLVRDLALPANAVVALIARGTEIIPPRGTTRILTGDHVFVVLRAESRNVVDRVFRSADLRAELPPIDFELRGSATVADLDEFYGYRLPGDDTETIDAVLRRELGEDIGPGSRLSLEGLDLVVRDMVDERIDTVGLHVTARSHAVPAEPTKVDGNGDVA